MLFGCIYLVCLGFAIGLQAQPLEQVREAERRWFQASGIADSNSIAEMLDESFHGITFDGRHWDKAAWVRAMREIETDSVRLPSWRTALSEYVSEDEAVRIVGDVAIVTGWRERDGGGHRFILVWLRSGDRWRITNMQTTNLATALVKP
jgi:uncharacterized protein DUF4440